jgi:hypothetical protein
MRARLIAIAAVSAVLFSMPASGHHSHAMYDSAQTVVIKGTVKSFDWTNPHCWLYVVVADETGTAREWSLEMGSTAGLVKEGWRPKTVAPGDTVSVALHPVKGQLQALTEGRNVGSLAAITLPDGTHIGDAALLK